MIVPPGTLAMTPPFQPNSPIIGALPDISLSLHSLAASAAFAYAVPSRLLPASPFGACVNWPTTAISDTQPSMTSPGADATTATPWMLS